jgi:hypothetical protein
MCLFGKMKQVKWWPEIKDANIEIFIHKRSC